MPAGRSAIPPTAPPPSSSAAIALAAAAAARDVTVVTSFSLNPPPGSAPGTPPTTIANGSSSASGRPRTPASATSATGATGRSRVSAAAVAARQLALTDPSAPPPAASSGTSATRGVKRKRSSASTTATGSSSSSSGPRASMGPAAGTIAGGASPDAATSAARAATPVRTYPAAVIQPAIIDYITRRRAREVELAESMADQMTSTLVDATENVRRALEHRIQVKRARIVEVQKRQWNVVIAEQRREAALKAKREAAAAAARQRRAAQKRMRIAAAAAEAKERADRAQAEAAAAAAAAARESETVALPIPAIPSPVKPTVTAAALLLGPGLPPPPRPISPSPMPNAVASAAAPLPPVPAISATGRPLRRTRVKAAAVAAAAAAALDRDSTPGDGDGTDADTPAADEPTPAVASSSSKPSSAATAAARAAAKAERDAESSRFRLWRHIALTIIPRAARSVNANAGIRQNNYKRLAKLLERESMALRRPTPRDITTVRGKRVMKEALVFWKHNEKVEKEAQKRAQAEALERQKLLEEQREVTRQERKLNFLLSQTELFTHFVSKKLAPPALAPPPGLAAAPSSSSGGNGGASAEDEAAAAMDTDQPAPLTIKAVADINFDDEAECAAQAQAYAADMLAKHTSTSKVADQFTVDVVQPKLLACELKEYQLKGLEWLISLYEQGINGILADEMGLGKTVQSIALLAWLAENHGMWGPYLVVTPASTLHNWQQELERFVPAFKVIPYWGTPTDRGVLRQFWAKKAQVYTRDSPAHVVVTSYQYAISDLKYLQAVEWEYMILDEAQAIKSSMSMRWNALLQVKSRNRLLLTGTPVQNSMKELWALLHFIMPTLFDSHTEFNEWFSRDIESAAVNKRQMNAEQVKRLHMILQPFMLRRVKRDVQSELGEKIEVNVSCALSKKQMLLYRLLKQKISIRDILDSVRNGASKAASAARAAAAARKAAKRDLDDELARDPAGAGAGAGGMEDDEDSSGDSLMNVVMQLRKVCNHPELLERSDSVSPFVMAPVIAGRVGVVAGGGAYVPANAGDVGSADAAAAATVSLPSTPADAQVAVRVHAALATRFPRRLVALVHDVSAVRMDGGQTLHVDVDVPECLTGYSAIDVVRVARYLNALQRAKLQEHLESTYPGVMRDVASWSVTGLQKGAVCDSDPFVRCIVRDARHGLLETPWIPSSLELVQPRAVALPPLEWEYVYADAPSTTVTSAFHALYWPPPDEDDSAAVALRYGSSTAKPAVPAVTDLIPIVPHTKSTIRVPNMQSMISASGKLQALEVLLPKLKSEGHRCLIYFQMTRMMDLMEDYLIYRKFSYQRLDGSTTLGDRRDLVSDWQTRDDLFIFLLSTRAGGVGINLTAADTVIFFDSDWNPTVDRQAMDRAHRLGQKRQVTVYRLVTRHSIEERILERARQKDHIQRVVISGTPGADATEDGDEAMAAAPSAKEMASLLFGDDDDDAAMRALLEEEMRKPAAGTAAGRARGGKKAAASASAGSAAIGEGVGESSAAPMGTPELGAATSTTAAVAKPKPKRAARPRKSAAAATTAAPAPTDPTANQDGASASGDAMEPALKAKPAPRKSRAKKSAAAAAASAAASSTTESAAPSDDGTAAATVTAALATTESATGTSDPRSTTPADVPFPDPVNPGTSSSAPSTPVAPPAKRKRTSGSIKHRGLLGQQPAVAGSGAGDGAGAAAGGPPRKRRATAGTPRKSGARGAKAADQADAASAAVPAAASTEANGAPDPPGLDTDAANAGTGTTLPRADEANGDEDEESMVVDVVDGA
ncbi:putative DNA helicase ino80 [Allomyces arbusculus]|nr:putative DNA helicase ino80 [Allomyces arbusculus]